MSRLLGSTNQSTHGPHRTIKMYTLYPNARFDYWEGGTYYFQIWAVSDESVTYYSSQSGQIYSVSRNTFLGLLAQKGAKQII